MVVEHIFWHLLLDFIFEFLSFFMIDNFLFNFSLKLQLNLQFLHDLIAIKLFFHVLCLIKFPEVTEFAYLFIFLFFLLNFLSLLDWIQIKRLSNKS